MPYGNRGGGGGRHVGHGGGGYWAVFHGLGLVNSTFSKLNRIVSKGVELIQSKDGLSVLKQILNKIWL
jgi:hypothetical protein